MQKVNFDYSLKCIPNSGILHYKKIFVDKAESVLNRMRWKLWTIKNPELFSTNQETYGFKSMKAPPSLPELKNFEDDVFNIIKEIRFKPIVNNQFQAKLKNDVQKIRENKEIYVKGDKSDNYYKLSKQTYEKLLLENITKDYKKCGNDEIRKTDVKAKNIAKNLNLDERIEKLNDSDAFLLIKDHKKNFPKKIECRVVNPTKTNIGKISKVILEKAVKSIKQQTQYHQWKSTKEVVEWFKNIQIEKNTKLFKFDIVSFYPSITETIFDESIDWASKLYSFTKEELDIIKHSKESFLTSKDNIWKKKTPNNFDVTIGSYDGAETCEIVGLYILSKIIPIFGKGRVGLYRDDGLGVVNGSGPELERMKKRVQEQFNKLNFKVTLETNLDQTEFLDLWLDIKSKTFKPFRKNDEKPRYIHKDSNHPPTIKKDIPSGIQNRLRMLSSTKEIFDSEAKVYEECLRQSGYTEKLEYKNLEIKPERKKRSRKIIWFNPPFNSNIQTNVAKKFLNLIDKHFGNTELKKYFNRKSVKVSYSCLPNIESIISSHNKKILNDISNEQAIKQCNCRKKADCPLDQKCQQSSVIYNAKVTYNNTESNYIGQTANKFKERFSNHKQSFKHEQYEQQTHLSKFVWSLKRQKKPYQIKWSILANAPSYNPRSKICHLCLTEKVLILTSKSENILNQRNEMMSRCKHKQAFLLCNI